MNIQLLKKIAQDYPDEIPYPFDSLMERIGFDALCAVVDEFGGANVYVPTIKTIFYDCIIKQLKSDFNGGNYRELCKKYGFCETTIRRMLRR